MLSLAAYIIVEAVKYCVDGPNLMRVGRIKIAGEKVEHFGAGEKRARAEQP